MNNYLIAGLVFFIFAVMFTFMTAYDSRLDVVAGMLYGGAMYSICMSMLDEKKVDDRG